MRMAPSFRSGESYQLTEYDLRTGASPQRFSWQSTLQWSIVLSTSLNSPVVPPNRVRKISTISITSGADAGGAEVLNYVVVYLQRSLTDLVQLDQAYSFNAAGLGGFYNKTITPTDLYLMPGELIFARAQKSAAVQSFSLALGLAGIDLPRGNIQTG
jgi:hypothetical protein